MYLLRRGHTRESAIEAAREAQLACEVPGAPAEAFLVLGNALIEAGNLEAFDIAMRDIERKYGADTRRGDIVRGLRSKADIRRNQWRSAEEHWNRLVDKQRPVHLALRARILALKAEDSSVRLHDRQAAEAEARQIRSDLGPEADVTLVLPREGR
jgi:hypothetical protein